MSHKKELFERRQRRVRSRVKKYVNADRPRLSVFRSNFHIYAQIIDDVRGCTLVSMATLDKELRSKLKKTTDTQAAEEVGRALARRAIQLGVKAVVFDRSGYLYHGRVKALALGARAEGLEF